MIIFYFLLYLRKTAFVFEICKRDDASSKVILVSTLHSESLFFDNLLHLPIAKPYPFFLNGVIRNFRKALILSLGFITLNKAVLPFYNRFIRRWWRRICKIILFEIFHFFLNNVPVFSYKQTHTVDYVRCHETKVK